MPFTNRFSFADVLDTPKRSDSTLEAVNAYAEIRQQVRENYRLAAYSFPQSSVAHLENNLDELWTVEKIGLWTAVAALAGRLAEGVLKATLVERGLPAASVGSLELGKLIQAASQQGILSPNAMSLSGRGVAHHTRRLRNWGAHFSLDSTTDELTATQAVATLVPFTEALHRRPTSYYSGKVLTLDSGWVDEHWQQLKPRMLLKALAKLAPHDPPGILSDPTPLYRHIVSIASMRTLAELVKFVRRLELPLDALRAEIRSGFFSILRGYAWSSTKGAVEVANSIRGIGLSDHGRVLNVMQPADAESIIELLAKRNPHYAARYINSLARS
ncbi:MAG: hypothetical protein ABW215_03255, partial [Kibdelosporangium sp.]